MLHSQKTLVFRFNPEVPLHLPLAVRSTGAYLLVPGSQIELPRQKWFTEVFWCEEGSGEFALGKQRFRINADELFFLLPGEIHDLRPLESGWKYRWFTLDHPQSPQWLEAFGLDERPLRTQGCPVRLFQNLMEALRKGTAQGDQAAAHCAHAILLAARDRGSSPFSKARLTWVDRCRKRIDKDYADPQLNVTRIAREMKLHRATLFRAFVQTYQITPSHYLQNRRLHHAMELLKQTDLPIKEVARRVGTTDANYLARLLRKVAGLSPRTFRAKYQQERKAIDRG